jgi:mRNA interferase MazF
MKRGDIVLVKFPFTDSSSDWVRPALVISSDAHVTTNPDAIFIYISSNINNPRPNDIIVEEQHSEFRQSGLKKPSTIKCDKIVTLSKVLVTRKLGEAGPTILQAIKTRLPLILGLN